ncbi:L-asparaginase [Nocardiopsis sp. Huas11]|uniref:asparaginase n=1 Tax=Nocardiopsis sp. Huas11 TaxID=2183912 RepID=UPI000EADD9C4|nr:asparaginase [Nocardiopsis sp. Huas11]RKS05092.1 L-asparaginase [Nocardiopsis sp. Huas11]
MRHLVLLGTGGTIATTATSHGLAVSANADDLWRQARTVWDPEEVRVEALDVNRIISSAASCADILALARAVAEAAARADGVVVTHGTDSMEESAFLVALTHRHRAPVAFTGAQRPFDDPAPDGPRNLAAALRWVADPRARGTGVSVVFGDTVLPAVGSRKVHTMALNGFAAPGRAPVAAVDSTGVRPYAAPAAAPAILSPDADLPRVDVIGQYLGVDATAVRAAVAAGARGLVLSAFGSGNTTPEVTAACLDLLGSGTPVVLASRVGAGPVEGVYAGGGADLVRAGALPAGDLSPWQARLLLAAVLTHPDGVQGVAERYRTWLSAVGSVG